MITVLVVDPSLASRKRLGDIVRGDREMKIVGEALDGEQALALTPKLRPDVIVLDMAMARKNHLEAARQIMTRYQTPIVILTAGANHPSNPRVVDALRAGAVDAMEKPRDGENQEMWAKRFRETLRAAAGVETDRRPRAPVPKERRRRAKHKPVELVVIGASTGGPGVAAAILAALPPLPVPLLLVVHFPGSLFGQFMEWLRSASRMPVVVPQEGVPLASLRGRICVAEPGRHLMLSGARLALRDGPAKHFCKPSVDVLFESIPKRLASHTLGVLLTGMGHDGAQGMLHIRSAGGRTIAQDEATSAVFGMPRAAIELDGADEVLPDREIAARISDLCLTPR